MFDAVLDYCHVKGSLALIGAHSWCVFVCFSHQPKVFKGHRDIFKVAIRCFKQH